MDDQFHDDGSTQDHDDLEQPLRREYPVEGRQHLNGPGFWMAMFSASQPGAASENWSTP
jgi:hypothetical protein